MTRSVRSFYSTDETGAIIPQAEISVNFAGGAEAPIYTVNSGGTPVSQPLISTSSGKAVFYVEPGVYDIESKDPISLTTSTFSNEEIGTSRADLSNDTDIDYEFATTEDLINNVFDTPPEMGSIANSKGFGGKGDGGKGSWKCIENTGAGVPLQSPAQLGDALLNDGNGNQWSIIGKALFTEQLGGVLDGVTDNTLVKDALLAWAQTSGGNIYIGNGVFLTGTTGLTSKDLKVFGLGQHLSEWKLKDNENANTFSLTGTGKLIAKHLTINQNNSNQTAGHGIRSGGCEKLLVEGVTIKNCYSYGIGIQAGTSTGVSLNDLIIHDVGRDGIDIKDYNLDNGVIFIDGYTCYNYDLLGIEQQVGIDIRGKVIATKVNIITNGNNYGVRFRVGGAQGRAGAGSIVGLDVTSSDTTTNSIALDLPSDSDNFTISNVTVDGVGLAIRQAATGVGGVISNLTAKNLIGTDCLSFAGSDLIVNGLNASNTASSSRIVDFETTADNIQISISY